MPDFETAQKIFQDDPTNLEVIKEWEKSYRKAAVMANLAESDAVKLLIEQLYDQIKFCESLLQEDRKKESETDQDFLRRRDALFTKRDCFKWLLSLFTVSRSKVESIEKTVDATIKNNS